MSNNTSESEFIDIHYLAIAVALRDWDYARELLQKGDARALVEYTSGGMKNPLHRVYKIGAPSDIIQAMLNASNRAPLTQDNKGRTPLHYAISSSSEENLIIRLIEACPQAASIIDIFGDTPLHLAIDINRSSNILRHLLAGNPTAASATTVSTFYRDKHNDTTPLHLFFGRWNWELRDVQQRIGLGLNSYNGDKNSIQDIKLRTGGYHHIRIGELYQSVLLLLQAATHGSIEENQEFRPLHAAINDPGCPWSFVNMIQTLDPKEASQWDREGNLPIHVAATATSSFEFSLRNSFDKIVAVIDDLIEINPKFAEIPDSEGRLPLSLAIEKETSIMLNTETIFQAAPEALSTRDIKTHLHPFMLSAVSFSEKTKKRKGEPSEEFLEKFESCYALLIENPVLVKSGIPLRGSKRSQDDDPQG